METDARIKERCRQDPGRVAVIGSVNVDSAAVSRQGAYFLTYSLTRSLRAVFAELM